MNTPNPSFLKPGLLAASGLLLLTACTIGGGRSGNADGFVNAQSMTGGTTILSAVTPTAPAGKNAFGRDRSVGGAGLTVAGVTSKRGLGVSAPSTVVYDLGAQCRTFTARVGVDDESGAGGSATFKVLVDDRPLFDSGVLKAGRATAVNVNVEGGETLKLVVEGGRSNRSTDFFNL